jgi:hypothetical protein
MASGDAFCVLQNVLVLQKGSGPSPVDSVADQDSMPLPAPNNTAEVKSARKRAQKNARKASKRKATKRKANGTMSTGPV